MAIGFDLTQKQQRLKARAREFAIDVLRPAAERADAIGDPHEAFRAMQPIYRLAAENGFTTMFLPRQYGGGGASNVDFLIAIEELCAADPGFPTILLVNGLSLMPILWLGTEEQRERWITKPPRTRPALSSPAGSSANAAAPPTSTIRIPWQAYNFSLNTNHAVASLW